jgi:hypothetical protein
MHRNVWSRTRTKTPMLPTARRTRLPKLYLTAPLKITRRQVNVHQSTDRCVGSGYRDVLREKYWDHHHTDEKLTGHPDRSPPRVKDDLSSDYRPGLSPVRSGSAQKKRKTCGQRLVAKENIPPYVGRPRTRISFAFILGRMVR